VYEVPSGLTIFLHESFVHIPRMIEYRWGFGRIRTKYLPKIQYVKPGLRFRRREGHESLGYIDYGCSVQAGLFLICKPVGYAHKSKAAFNFGGG